MKKILILILTLLLLGGLLYFLINRYGGDKESVEITSESFSIEDTASIDKVFLANLNEKESLIERKKDGWYVKQGDEWRMANQSRVEILLSTLRRVRVKNPVPLSMKENVVKAMATSSVKVEVYSGDKMLKSFYVDGTTPDEMGTYMALNDNQKKPVVTHIPGFEGYLSSRFFADTRDWLSKRLFSYNPLAIREVSVMYNDSIEKSFTLKQKENGKILISGIGSNSFDEANDRAAKLFLISFRNKQAERKLTRTRKAVYDSLQNEEAVINIRIETKNKSQKTKLYPVNPDLLQSEVPKERRKVTKYYAISDQNPGSVYLMQRSILEENLKTLSDLQSDK